MNVYPCPETDRRPRRRDIETAARLVCSPHTHTRRHAFVQWAAELAIATLTETEQRTAVAHLLTALGITEDPLGLATALVSRGATFADVLRAAHQATRSRTARSWRAVFAWRLHQFAENGSRLGLALVA
jgi:hypothetical protein